MSRRPPVKIPDSWRPTDPHPDKLREALCVAITSGETAAAAYREHLATGAVSEGSARSGAHRVCKEPEVKARIAFLKRELAAARMALEPESVSAAELRSLMHEVTRSYAAALRAARAKGMDPARVGEIRQAFTTHVKRVPERRGPEELEETAEDLFLLLDRLSLCDCHE